MRGGRRGGLWSEEEIASSGTGSERAQGRELRLRGPLREPGDPVRRESCGTPGRRRSAGDLPVEIVPLVIHQDERREVDDLDPKDRLHPQFGVLEHLHLTDVLEYPELGMEA